MRSAKIENGLVVNVIVGEQAGYIRCPRKTAIGWEYINGRFIEPDPPVHIQPSETEELEEHILTQDKHFRALIRVLAVEMEIAPSVLMRRIRIAARNA